MYWYTSSLPRAFTVIVVRYRRPSPLARRVRVARHCAHWLRSWASISGAVGVPVGSICGGLGHANAWGVLSLFITYIAGSFHKPKTFDRLCCFSEFLFLCIQYIISFVFHQLRQFHKEMRKLYFCQLHSNSLI